MAVSNLGALRDALVRLIRSASEPLVELESDTQQLPARVVGQVLRAQVVAQLPNGRSVVDIQGAPFDVKLPVALRTGDTVDLEVLALEPRPTFALRSAAMPLVELAGDTMRLPARAIGQVFQAQVVAELPNGRSSIEIDGVRYDVKLPVPARAGETLQLEVRALEPRVTLAIAASAAGPARDPVAVSESVRRLAAILDRIAPPPTDATTTARPIPASAGVPPPIATTVTATPLPIASSPPPGAAQTNTTAPSHSATIASAPAASNTGATVAPTSVAPVIPSPPRDTAALAESLKLALTQSGVFYESHQAQWVAGQRPLDDVMREPQASLKPASEPVHPQTIGLVRQQLEILDTRQLVWQGQVWPEQSMEWRIEEDRAGGNAADDLPVWRTSLRLKLPRLGEVTATLAIQGDEIRIAFTELDSDARNAVRDGQIVLREAFAKAGLALLEMKVDRDEA
jgi:hypothetical protein